MAGYGGLPNNLPDIDADDMYAPDAYRRWVEHQGDAGEVPQAAIMEQRHSNVPSYHEVPRYHELDYGAYDNNNNTATPHNDLDYYVQQEKAEVEYDLGIGAGAGGTPVRHVDFARRTARYATPELEGQALRGEDTSFDGPEDYASTADHHGNAPLQSSRATARRTPTTTPRRRFGGLYRSTNSKQEEGDERFSSNSLANTLNGGDNEKDYHDPNPHFGPVPTVQLRRNRTKRRIGLTAGNLVIDAPIPSRLAGFLPRKGTEEFDKMRCVAVQVSS
jgi:hypothetical protein